MTQEKRSKRAKTPEVFQTEACECGAASLSMILRYYGCELPLEQIRYECGISRDGCSAADLIMAGRHYGLIGKGFRVALEKLEETPVPCILHWNFNHFVVLEGIKGKYFYINDPAHGHRKLTEKEMDRSYTGIALTFSPGPEFKTCKQPSGVVAMIKERLLPEKQAVAYVICAGLFLMIPGLAIPALSSEFVDNLYAADTSYIMVLVIAMALLLGFQILMTTMRSYILSVLTLKISVISADKLVWRMLHLPMLFYDQRYSGDLARRMEIDRDVNSFLVNRFLQTILDFFTAAASLVLMWYISPLLTVVGILGTALSILVSRFVIRPVSSLNMLKKQEQCTLTGVLCAGISSAESIKACGVESEFSAELLNNYAGQTVYEQKLGAVQQILGTLPAAITSIFTVLVMGMGAVLTIKGQMTIGVLTAFTQLLSSFSTPVNSIVGFTLSIEEMKAGFSKVEDIETAALDSRFEKDADAAELQGRIARTVQLQNVSFGYSPNLPPVVSGISFKAGPGSSIAIVGASGCGKSTVGKLISGLLTPWTGSILLDGRPMSDYADDWLTAFLSVVSQKSDFFSGTIRENITMMKSDFPDEMLNRALADSVSDEFVNRLNGTLDYMLDEGARNLSGGQRQRLQIARALATDPTVLVLDEATSALDAVTEKQIMDNIRKRGCTCLIIAHRLSTIRDCDLILVMNEGKIVEFGKHQQLMERNGLYKSLVTSQ